MYLWICSIIYLFFLWKSILDIFFFTLQTYLAQLCIIVIIVWTILIYNTFLRHTPLLRTNSQLSKAMTELGRKVARTYILRINNNEKKNKTRDQSATISISASRTSYDPYAGAFIVLHTWPEAAAATARSPKCQTASCVSKNRMRSTQKCQ